MHVKHNSWKIDSNRLLVHLVVHLLLCGRIIGLENARQLRVACLCSLPRNLSVVAIAAIDSCLTNVEQRPE